MDAIRYPHFHELVALREVLKVVLIDEVRGVKCVAKEVTRNMPGLLLFHR